MSHLIVALFDEMKKAEAVRRDLLEKTGGDAVASDEKRLKTALRQPEEAPDR